MPRQGSSVSSRPCSDLVSAADTGGGGRLRVRVPARPGRVLRQPGAGLRHRTRPGLRHHSQVGHATRDTRHATRDTRHVTRGIMMESPLQTDSVHDEQLRPQHRRAGVLPGVRPGLSANPGARSGR